MRRNMILCALVVALAAFALGCGGSELQDSAPGQAPTNLGDPNQFPMGVTLHQMWWIVKTEIDGEKRLYAFDNSSTGPIRMQLQYDENAKVFYSTGRRHRYDLTGNAIHTVPDGPNKGNPGDPMTQREVKLDPQTGDLLLYTYLVVGGADRDNLKKNAFVLVP